MHQRKLAAKPRKHLTPFNQRPVISNKVFYVNGHACRLLPSTRNKTITIREERYQELSKYKWVTIPRSDGKGYYAVRFYKTKGKWKQMRMHNQIMGGGRKVDHKNGNGLDNRDDNLRYCTDRQNSQNKVVRCNSQSGYKGAFTLKDPLKNGKTHRSYIQADGKKIYLGFFYSAEEAARAYDRAAILYFGEFAHTNFPLSDYTHCVGSSPL